MMQWLPLNVATLFARAPYTLVILAARLILEGPVGLG